MRVLTVSCRRTDVLYSLFDTTAESARARGAITGIGDERAEHVLHVDDKPVRTGTVAPATHEAVLAEALAALTGNGGPLESAADVSAVGHRVCHGGPRHGGPAVVDDDVLRQIAELADLAPMENPYNLMGVEIFRKLLPEAKQVVVFDTSFHLGMPRAASRYALPDDIADPETLRRFGGHGISHEGAARAAAELLGMNFDALRLITCHLGGGASMCAIDHGRSVDTTMGLTLLGGLVSSTRPGDLDAGLMLHLLGRQGADAGELTRRLYEQSGLLGLSGLSGDVLTVLEAAGAGDARALEAVQVYCHCARKYLAGYIGLLGGADAIVFTGGVGRNQPGVRARICQGLEYMGIVLDEGRNRQASVAPGEAVEISADRSRAKVIVAGTNEQHTIARHTVRALAQKPVTEVMRGSSRPIPIGISAHHVHLTDEHVEALFGEGHTLTWHADLSQPGQFACKEQVTLIGPKGSIERVRVLGPVMALKGNVNPMLFLPNNTGRLAEACEAAKRLAPQRGFILSTGCLVPRDSAPEAFRIMAEACDK